MKKLFAFTLAEVLITLGIIGVVASITIPVLMNNISDANYKTMYKKAFSAANNAFKQATADGTTYVPMSSSSDNANACVNWQIFSSQFKKSKECINGDTNQCWDMSSSSETAGGSPGSSVYAFVDASGMAWSMRYTCNSSSGGGYYFLIDTNGFKGPNKYGKDRWVFQLILGSITSGNPIKIYIPNNNRDWNPGQTDATFCPTGPCYYQSWLLN